MKITLKIFGMLLMSMVLMTSCGKDDNDEPNTPNGGVKISTVKEMMKKNTKVGIGHKDKSIREAKTKYFNQLKDLVMNGKTYKKVEVTAEQAEKFKDDFSLRDTGLSKNRITLNFWSNKGASTALTFYILLEENEKGKTAVFTLGDGIYFTLEGTLDTDKISEVCDKALEDRQKIVQIQ